MLVHDFAPKYLGVTLDRSLTYRKYTENVRDKVKSRCNIINKLAGTEWGSPAPVLRTSAIALVYSVAEYRVPVWGRCANVQHIDTQLNIAMRTVAGPVTPGLRPGYDLPTTEKWANRRKNVRLVAEVVRLVAEVVDDRKGQISRNKVVVMFKTRSHRAYDQVIDHTIDRRGPRSIVRSIVYGYH